MKIKEYCIGRKTNQIKITPWVQCDYNHAKMKTSKGNCKWKNTRGLIVFLVGGSTMEFSVCMSLYITDFLIHDTNDGKYLLHHSIVFSKEIY